MARTTKSKTARSAKQAKTNGRNRKPVIVTSHTPMRGGEGTYVTFSDNSGVSLASWQYPKSVAKLLNGRALTKGEGPTKDEFMAAVNAVPRPAARLANGVEARQNPHSAKAVRDERASRRSSRAAKARGDAAAIAGKPAPKARKQGGRRGYDPNAKLTTLVKPKDSGLAAGSGRMAKLVFAAKCKTVGAFLGQTVTDDNGKVHKCDAGALSGMLKRQHVRIG